jgi:hypothetical protein
MSETTDVLVYPKDMSEQELNYVGSCWYTEEVCSDCGNRIATNGRFKWCTSHRGVCKKVWRIDRAG